MNYPFLYKSDKIPKGTGFCRSPLEFSVFNKLNKDPRVLSYTIEPFKLQYDFNGERRNYLPDLLVTYNDNSRVLVEVKVVHDANSPMNIAKWENASVFCEKEKMMFQVWLRESPNIKFAKDFSGEYNWKQAVKISKKRQKLIKNKIAFNNLPSFIQYIIPFLICITIIVCFIYLTTLF